MMKILGILTPHYLSDPRSAPGAWHSFHSHSENERWIESNASAHFCKLSEVKGISEVKICGRAQIPQAQEASRNIINSPTRFVGWHMSWHTSWLPSW